MHRSQVSHDCIAPTIDMTSVDCPICGKSFKFNKTNDPNLEWDRHLATSCSQQPETQNNRIKCQAPQCNVVLGPSNRITCNQCHRQVCLSHRIPDQHNCKELRRADTLRSKGQQSSHLTPKGQQSSQSAARQPSRQQASEARPSRLSQSTDSTNTLKGSATRRQQQQPHVTAPAPPLLEPCPMCGARFPDALSLANHFEQSHSSENQTHSSPPPQRSGPIEVSASPLVLFRPSSSPSDVSSVWKSFCRRVAARAPCRN
jgi:predicted nucleic acid binding AN1-type Zn finger protein